jgi:hypothetical protein
VVGEKLPVYPITHLSYSTLSSWFECPKKVQLAKERKAPARTAWWFAGGSAVHAASDAYDRWTLLDPVGRPRFALKDEWDKAFDEEVDDIAKRHPDKSLWRNAGSKDVPETYARWKDTLGPELVKAYILWRQRSPWTLWHTPQGEPAIELDLSTTFPGCDREVKAYVDRVFVDPMMGDKIIVDFKSGTRQPEGPLQFGVYNAGMIELYGEPCRWGYAFMNRRAELAKPYDLTKYTPEYVGAQFAALGRAVTEKVWPAHVGHACKMCDVQTSCYAADGEFSALFDPDDPDYVNKVPF